ncbi:MAG: threonine--tRNA ligase [Oscillospiraceae bacterium]|jgi:threonyl-tRNA synthetase|nr:threonine--tRNA ligase [Oscillospiraceae bacterium]
MIPMKLVVNGSPVELRDGTALDAAEAVSPELKKNALAARVNGAVQELWRPLKDGDTVDILTFEDEEGRRVFRHTSSHVMAEAARAVRPEAKIAIGPAIENGFYYDFDVDAPFTPEDLEKINKEMARIIKRNDRLERFEMPRAEAIAYWEEKGEPYKVELIHDLPEGAAISFYKMGGFTDLCAGPHLGSTGRIKAIQATHASGAYWRGSEKNKMLQRVYGTSFPTKEALDAYLLQQEEARKRDHRRLGRELDLFSILEEGPGFAFFHPKGMIIRNELEDYWRGLHRKNGYQEIKTPILLSCDLWKRSGHWDHYRDNMYTTKIDEQDFAVKPMNCPGGMLVYKRRVYSYRDLPLRMGELGLVHRHELSGALHGLMRVRSFTQDDAHIFMTQDQVKREVQGVIRLISGVYNGFGFPFHMELSTRPEDSIGEQADWDAATDALREAMEDLGLPFKVNEGDGAFYGPKIDFHIRDSIGRTWQCGTIQLDFQMPELFDLTYAGADGQKHRPAMVHRVVFGSIERFIGILTEHFAGAFPLWLSPVQARALTITDRADERAKEIVSALEEAGVRAELDLRNEKIGFKIREARLEMIPYLVVLGDQEVVSGDLAVRGRKGDLGKMELGAFRDMLAKEIRDKSL